MTKRGEEARADLLDETSVGIGKGRWQHDTLAGDHKPKRDSPLVSVTCDDPRRNPLPPLPATA
jgi:hypothetical protein